jgi:hypothetical protein
LLLFLYYGIASQEIYQKSIHIFFRFLARRAI